MTKELNNDLIIDFLFDKNKEYMGNHNHILNLIKSDVGVQEIYEKEKDSFNVERYINNDMSQQETVDFELKVKKNPELKKEIKLSKDIDLFCFFKSLGDKYHSDIENEKLYEIQKSNIQTLNLYKKKVMRWAAAAILVLLASVSSVFYLPSDNAIDNTLFAEYYKTDADEELNLIDNYHFKKINSPKDYVNEPDILKEPSEINTRKYQEQLLMKGQTLIEQKRYTEATGILFELYNNVSTDNAYLRSVTGWYLGLCYLYDKRIVEASVIFRYVADCKVFKAKEAEEILEKLEKVKS